MSWDLVWCGVWHVVVSSIVSGASLCLMCCGLLVSGGQLGIYPQAGHCPYTADAQLVVSSLWSKECFGHSSLTSAQASLNETSHQRLRKYSARNFLKLNPKPKLELNVFQILFCCLSGACFKVKVVV